MIRKLPVAILLVVGVFFGWYFARLPPHARPLITSSDARRMVEVRSQASGAVKAVYAHRGAKVHRGSVLALIDPEPFEIQLNQAQAALDTARADAAEAHVALDQASGGLVRTGRQTEPEKRLAHIEVMQAQAEIDIADAQVQQDEAAVEQAKANLDRAEVLAPADGLVMDRSAVAVGKMVEPGDPLFKILMDPPSTAGR